jgi:hypothetical protein
MAGGPIRKSREGDRHATLTAGISRWRSSFLLNCSLMARISSGQYYLSVESKWILSYLGMELTIDEVGRNGLLPLFTHELDRQPSTRDS